jgi:Family of unknown function (DUF5681)
MTDDDEIGYGKPPKRTQFRPGQSGNPKGRPKEHRNLATDLEEELNEKILVTEGGRQLQTTKQRAMLKALLAKALKGDTRAASALIQLKVGLEQARSGKGEEAPLEAEDQAILDAFLSRREASEKPS